MENLQDVNVMLKDNEVEELSNLANELHIVTEDTSTAIDIEDFEEYILPYIIGEVEPTEENYTTFVANYIGLATKATKSLLIQSNGVVKYKLPPMIASTTIDDTEAIDLTKMHGSQRQATNGKTAKPFLDGLQNLVNTAKRDDNTLTSYADDLKRIKADYGITKPKDEKTVKSTEIEYGDFLD